MIDRTYFYNTQKFTVKNHEYDIPKFVDTSTSQTLFNSNVSVGAYNNKITNKSNVSMCHAGADNNATISNVTFYTGLTGGNTKNKENEFVYSNITPVSLRAGLSRPTYTYGQIQYMKSSASGSNIINNTPFANLECKPKENLSSDTKYYGLSDTYTPILSFPTNNIILVPFIHCFKCKTGKQITDIEVYSTMSGKTAHSAVFDSMRVCDLKTYESIYTEFPYVSHIYLVAFVKNESGGYSVTSDIKTMFTNQNINVNYLDYDDISHGGNIDFLSTHDFSIGNCYITKDDDSTMTLTVDSMSTIFGTNYTNQIYNRFQYTYNLYPVIGENLEFHKVPYNSSEYNSNIKSTYYCYHVVDNYETFKEFARRQTAYYGLLFKDNADMSTVNATQTNDNLFMGVIDDSGITHGEYTSGLENVHNKQYGLNDFIEKTPYLPTGAGSNDFGDLKTRMHSGYYLAGTKYHVLNADKLNNFVNVVNNYSKTGDDLQIDFKGENPFNYVTCCLFYPFDIPNAGAGNTIKLGKFDTLVSGNTLYNNYGINNIFDYGTINIDRYFNDFRDLYNVSAKLHLPFCGSLDIDMSFWYNHSMTCKLIVDFQTGKCTTAVFRDGLCVDMVNGSCGSTVPLTLKNMSDYQNTIENMNNQKKTQNLASVISGVASVGAIAGGMLSANVPAVVGGVAGIVSTVEKAATNKKMYDYNISHTKPNVGNIGGSSPMIDFCFDYIPRLIITYPQTLKYNDNEFKNTIGYACMKTGRLADFSGFTVCQSVNVINDLTITEKNIIESLCKTGIIL